MAVRQRGGGRPVGAGAAGRGRGGRRYVSAVAADGDARNADDLHMPSAPPPTPAASCVLAYLKADVASTSISRHHV